MEILNFHKCDNCPYVTKSLQNMENHMISHTKKTKRDVFFCDTNSPEILKCFCDVSCDFKTRLKVVMDIHKIFEHKGVEVRTDLEVIVGEQICKNCEFVTSSQLVYLTHVCPFEENCLQNSTKWFKGERCTRNLEYSTPWPQCYCSHETTTKNDVKSDLKKKKKKNSILFPCNKCLYEAKTKSNLRLHDITKHMMNKWTCPVCKLETFYTKTDDIFECLRCSHVSSRFDHVNYYNNHNSKNRKLNMNRVAIEHSYQKPVSFKKLRVANHDRITPKLKSVNSIHHNKTEQQSQNMNVKRSKKKYQVFECLYCSYTTTNENVLYIHVLTNHHPTGVKNRIAIEHSYHRVCNSIKVEYCNFVSNYRSGMKMHVPYYKNNLQYQCEFCEIKVKDFNSLRRHVRGSHRNIKWFGCTYCKFKSKEKFVIDNHVFMEHVNKIK